MTNDDTHENISGDPDLRNKLQNLRRRMNQQEKRKKLIRRKMANSTNQNPIGNQQDWKDTLDTTKQNQMSLDNMVLRGNYKADDMLAAELKRVEDTRDLKNSKLFDIPLGKEAQRNNVTNEEDQKAKKLLEDYPYIEGGYGGSGGTTGGKKKKGDSGGGVALNSENPSINAILKGMRDQLESKEDYLDQLMQNEQDPLMDYKKRRQEHLHYVKES